MADVKTLQTRIALKYDSYANWTDETKEGLGANLVLLKGEIGICAIESKDQGAQTAPTVLFKVGDGENTFKNLKWASALAADVYDWAKSETVVLNGTNLQFKTGDKVNHSVDLSSFATDAEVEAVRSALDSRIVALEEKFTGEGSVQGQLDALDGRLDIIEGEGAGSIKKAEADAKAYTDAREVEIKKYADQAEADAVTAANSYTDGKVTTINAELTALDGRLDVIEGEAEGSVKKALADAKAYADQAELDAVAAAKEYTDDRETAITTAYQTYADQAEADAKKHADDEIAAAVATIEAKDEAQDTAIQANADNLAQEILDRAAADKAITDSIGTVADGKTVVKMIEDAETAAKAAAAEDAANKVKALADGAVATNAAAIEANAKAIADEKERAEGVEGDFEDRISAMEAFFEAADHDGEEGGLTDALDTLKEIQDYLNGEGSAADGILGEISDLKDRADDLEAEFAAGGRVTVAEAAIDAVEARLDDIEGEDGLIAAGDAATLASAKEYTDEREEVITEAYEAYADQAELDAVASAKDYTDAEIKKLDEAMDAANLEITTDIENLEKIVKGYEGEGSIKTAVDAAQEAADAAQEAADKAQGEVDDLEDVVATLREEYNVTKALATTNAADIEALTTRVTTAEGEIDALQATVDTATTGLKDRMTAAETDIDNLQTLTGDAAKGNEALYTEVTRVAGLVDDTTTGLAATKVIADRADAKSVDNASRLDTIESDYLKMADLFIIDCGTASTVTHEKPNA